MKAKIVLNVLAGIGIMALSVTVAHAGGGPGAVSFAAFFECQSINGTAKVGEVVSIYDVDTQDVIHPSATVGTGLLACKQVQVRDSSGLLLGPDSGGQLKCYSIAIQQGPQGDPPKDLTFTYVFTTETVRVFGSKYLCVTAGTTAP